MATWERGIFLVPRSRERPRLEAQCNDPSRLGRAHPRSQLDMQHRLYIYSRRLAILIFECFLNSS